MHYSKSVSTREFEQDQLRALRNITEKRLHQLFGSDVPEEVLARYEDEMNIIAHRGHAMQYLVAELIASKAGEMSMPFWIAGPAASSFVAYLCGVTAISPLPEAFGGVDIPFETTGEKYANRNLELSVRTIEPLIVMVQSAFQEAYPDYQVITVSIPIHPFSPDGFEVRFCFVPKDEDLKREVMDSFDQELAWRSKVRGDSSYMPYVDLQYFSVTFTHDEDLMRVYLSGDQMDKEELSIVSPEAIEAIWNYTLIKDEVHEPFASIPVKTLHDLVKMHCLLHGTDVIDDNLLETLVSGKTRLPDVICSRDDVFLVLVGLGYDRQKSFQISERVRKGRGLNEDLEADMRRIGVSDEVINQCKNVKYLFMKAYAAEKVRKYAWLAIVAKHDARKQEEFIEAVRRQAPLIEYEKPGITLIAGRPSMGKTALALRITRDACLQQKKAVRYYSLESISLERRTLAAVYGNNPELLYVESHLLSVDEIINDCRKYCAKGNEIGLILVDYIQLAFGDTIESVQKLQTYSEEISCPIVVLSQVNRSLEQREDKHPTEEDLPWDKENNVIFKQMMFIYRDYYYNVGKIDRETQEGRKTEVTVLRDPDKEAEVIHLYMDYNKMIFEDRLSD